MEKSTQPQGLASLTKTLIFDYDAAEDRGEAMAKTAVHRQVVQDVLKKYD
jgi:hypothetical protein